MEVNSSYGAFMFFKLFQDDVCLVVYEVDGATVERGEEPWSFRVEGQALDSTAL